MFFVMVSLVGLMATAFTAKCLFSASMGLAAKIWIVLPVLLSWFAPVYVYALMDAKLFGSAAFSRLNNVGFYLFGTAFFLFAVLLIRNAVWFSAYGVGKLARYPGIERFNPSSPDLLNKVNLVTVVLTLVISLYAVYEGVKIPPVKEVIIETDKPVKEFTFVQLSDIHIHRGVAPEKIIKLVEKVNALKPDVIFLTGDIGDDEAAHVMPAAEKLGGLKSRYGTYVVMGNHELYRGYKAWEKVFKDLGFTVLYNEGFSLNGSGVFAGGVADASFAYAVPALKADADKTFENARAQEYKILLAHSPLLIRGDKTSADQPHPFDLQISGHTHGGQIFPFHFLVKPVNKYLAGLYPVNGGHLYVSRGTGYWGPPMRLLAPSEITLFKINPGRN